MDWEWRSKRKYRVVQNLLKYLAEGDAYFMRTTIKIWMIY